MRTHGRRTRLAGRRLAPRAAALVAAVAVASLPSSTVAGAGSAAGNAGRPRSAAGAVDASDEFPVTECGTVDGKGCAPTNQRVDLERPTFTHPLDVTNPLFPVSRLHSVVQVGRVDGEPFRSETTTLPQTGVVDWYGQKVPVVLSQYVGYVDGRIEEVALDRYAQADDGSVWYFGEDVIDYRNGGAFLTEGTWLAGRDGPPAMVMPAHPELGDVFRVENVLGIVFEELRVVRVDRTVRGPGGPVGGAIVVDELGVDGGHSRKTLAPGYGEFLTRNEAELETVAVASPVDAIDGGAPAGIRHVYTASWGTWEYARGRSFDEARASVRRIADAVARLDTTQQPFRVMRLLHRSVAALTAAARTRNPRAIERETLDVAQAAIDLEARYLPPERIEASRFHLHTMALRVAAASNRRGDVTGEVAALELVRQRLAIASTAAAEVDSELTALRTAADSGNLVSTADVAARLGSLVRNATGA